MFSYQEDENQYYHEVEKRMYQYQQDCLVALTDIVHPKYINKFARVLSYAFEQQDMDAQSIADDLKLDELNFLAVLERDKDFEEALFQKEEREFLNNLSFEEVGI